MPIAAAHAPTVHIPYQMHATSKVAIRPRELNRMLNHCARRIAAITTKPLPYGRSSVQFPAAPSPRFLRVLRASALNEELRSCRKSPRSQTVHSPYRQGSDRTHERERAVRPTLPFSGSSPCFLRVLR